MITLTKFLEEAKRTIPQDKDVATKKKAAPKKYHEKLSTSTKRARAKHFEERGKMADDNPAAYTPAPGDEKASTRESKYTKAYKKRFGEDVKLKYLDDEFFMEEVDQLFPCEYEVLDEDEILVEADNSEGLKKKSEKSGIPMGILRSVYNRGMAAWKGGHRPGTTPQQWAFARVNSFISGGKTRTTADKDLWAKASAAKKKKKGKNSGKPKKKSSKQ